MADLIRHFTRRGLLGLAGALGAAGCSRAATRNATSPAGTPSTAGSATAPDATPAPGATPQPNAGRAIVVYFSRPGQNYDQASANQSGNGRPISDLAVGNTEVLAGYLVDLLGCPVHRLLSAAPYPHSYDDTVALNVAEQRREARPAIANPLTSLAGVDTVLIGSPIWNNEAPRIIRTFIDANDFTGLTVAPFTTHAGSGLGGTRAEYQRACRGVRAVTEGLPVRGEEARQSRELAAAWLRRIGLLRG